jgi:hypothetical protein
MTVHFVRVYVEPPKGNAQSAIDNRITNYSEWSGSATKHGLVSFPPDGEERYLTGFWRFEEQGETPTGILQRLYDNLSTFQGGLWFRAFYHICDHDREDNFGDCPVADYAAEYGSVPDDIKDIPPDAEVVVRG